MRVTIRTTISEIKTYNEISEKIYPQHWWRWINLICFFFAMVATASIMTSFSAVSSQVAKGYGTSEIVVNTATISFFVSFIVMNFPSIIGLEAGKTQGFGMMISVSVTCFD